MLTTVTKSVDDYYSHDRQSYATYTEYGKNIRKRFIIEYCDDKKKFDRLGLCGPKGLEIDDAYHQLVFEEKNGDYSHDTMEGIATERYLHMLFNSKILDVKFYEEIYDGDKLLQERWIEFPSTFYHSFAKIVARDVIAERDMFKEANEVMAKENELLKAFIKRYNAENTYEAFREEIA